MKRRPLRTRIALSLLAYALVIGASILSLGYAINEGVERHVWQAMLSAEVQHLVAHPELLSADGLLDTGTMHAYRGSQEAGFAHVPETLRALSPGLHDEVAVGDHEFAVLVQPNGAETVYMTIDITELESSEASLTGIVMLWSIGLALGLAATAWWIAGRLTRPITQLVAAIDRLRPDEPVSRLAVDGDNDAELQRIIDALNGLLARTDGYLARERAFVTMASHELRTPVAVITGAITLAQGYPNIPDGLRRALQRVARASRDMEQLIRILLVLAKSPDRVMATATDLELSDVVQDVIEDHAHLCAGKALAVETRILVSTPLHAPVQLVQIALANLLRNAIEQSDAGTIELSVSPAGVVRIVDPGHGLSPEEISKHYAQRAKHTGDEFTHGIGLPLIARICEHLGWVLDVRSDQGNGTSITLDLRQSMTVSALD